MKQGVKYFFIICFFQFGIYNSYSQCNIVKNPSFEQYSICPNGNHNIYLANTWNALNNITSANDTNECSGIYYNTCANSIGGDYDGVPGPGSYLNYQYPKSGYGYIGIDLYDNCSSFPWLERMYAKGSLTQTLIAGKTYCFKMWANLANMSKYQCNNMMVYFDNGSIDTAKCGLPVAITPQIINSPNVAITDTLNWVLVTGSFIANGTENTITIGNFKTNAQSQISVFNTSGNWYCEAFYLIDDVSLIPIDLVPYAGNDTAILHGDSTFIGRPFEIGLNDDCVWYVLGNSTPFDTIAGMWVKPATTTSYVVKQNICGVISYDTVKVTVNTISITKYSIANNQLSVYPNPNNGRVYISGFDAKETSTNIEITDVTGKLVYKQQSNIGNSVVELNLQLISGVYFVHIINSQGATQIQKIVINN